MTRRTAGPGPWWESDLLARAEQHIAEADRRVAAQVLLVEQMAERGHDTAAARDLLRLLEEVLAQWHACRQLLLGTPAGSVPPRA